MVTTSTSPRSGPFEKDRSADRIGQRRHAIEAGPFAGNGLVARRLEVAGAGVVRFDLETFAGLDAQQRLVFPVEGVLAGVFAQDSLHDGPGLAVFLGQ